MTVNADAVVTFSNYLRCCFAMVMPSCVQAAMCTQLPVAVVQWPLLQPIPEPVDIVLYYHPACYALEFHRTGGLEN